MPRALVVHASKYGSVEEVAQFVAEVLRDEGVECDVARASEQGVAGYDLVVLGAGLYMSRLHRDARRFLRRHGEELTRMPFAVFAMGPLSADPEERMKVRPQLERELARHPGLVPVASEIFGGVIVPERMSFPFNRLPAGDHRDWEAIRTFALSLPLVRAVPA